MRCPKCGFISFDSLLLCGRCQSDLSLVSAELRGTATEMAGTFFLGNLLSGGESRPESVASGVTSEAAEILVAGGAPEDSTAGIAGEEASPAGGEEPPALEFDLDEMPSLEAEPAEIALEPSAPEDASAASVFAPEAASLAPVGEGEAALPAPDQPDEPGPLGVELELKDVSLNLGEEVADAAAAGPGLSEEAAPAGPPAVDLNEIDISDLVAGGRQEAAPFKEEGALDLDETIDLSLFAEPVEGVSPPAAGAGEEGLAPIDLALGGDALLDLTVDPARKGKAAKGSEDLALSELSMEGPGN
ncbi:MAG: hypothetical protein M0Z90_08980 [Desulfobacteraceae bacterium]|nr:hypothetical protein [Desulfobacteraceae bacterium]